MVLNVQNQLKLSNLQTILHHRVTGSSGGVVGSCTHRNKCDDAQVRFAAANKVAFEAEQAKDAAEHEVEDLKNALRDKRPKD